MLQKLVTKDNKKFSACRRREKRKLSNSLIDVITKIEEQRKAEREERERKKRCTGKGEKWNFKAIFRNIKKQKNELE